MIAHRLSTVRRANLVSLWKAARSSSAGRTMNPGTGRFYRRIYDLQLRPQDYVPAAAPVALGGNDG